MDKSKSFEEKYSDYFFKVNQIDYFKKAEILDIQRIGNSLVFDFYDRELRFNDEGINDIKEHTLTYAVRTVLCQYLLMCQEPLPKSSGKLVTLREISNSGPLFSSVVTNTGKIIETTFAGNSDNLKKKCLKLQGTILKNDSYDISVKFNALSKVPITLIFNDKDEMMPANASFLFQDDAGSYLDLDHL